MKIAIHGSVVYFTRNRKVVFTINNKWLAKLFRMFRFKVGADQL